MAEDPVFQFPEPNMMVGFTITAFSPSLIPLHTSSSPKYLLLP